MRTAIAAIVMSCLAAPVFALPIQFTIGSGSSVSLTNKDRDWVCDMRRCNVQASIANGLAGTSFSLDEGEVAKFDFITFKARRTGYIDFDINATLDFDEPNGADLSIAGEGDGVLLGGNIVTGSLDWGSNARNRIKLDDGSIIKVVFEEGTTIFDDDTTTIWAKVKVQSSGVVQNPLPAAGLLLVGGLGALGAMRIRKSA